MSAYGPTAGKKAGVIARAIKDGLTRTAKGERVTTSWCGSSLDHDGLRAWFRDKIDGMINLKAGLRSDGAPKKTKCRCLHCPKMSGPRCDCACRKVTGTPAPIVTDCGYGCRAPWGGRKWEDDWHWRAYRDSRRARERVTQRIAVHRFETEDARKRLGHLLTTWED